MSDQSKPTPSLPEDIAGRAGLPRQEDVGHSLHTAADHAGQAAQSLHAHAREYLGAGRDAEDKALGRAGAEARDLHAHAREFVGEARERIEETAETAAREAANASSDIRSRVSGVADAARERVGDTVERVREHAADTYDDVRAWASDHYETHSRRAADLADRGYLRLRKGRSATEAFVSDNPLLVGVVGLAAGLLLGSLLPRTRREDTAIGPWADEVRDQGLRYAREMTHRGRAFVETALDPDNLDRAARQSGLSPDETGARSYEGPERTAHRL